MKKKPLAEIIQGMTSPQTSQPTQPTQPKQFDFSKVHLHIAMPCYGGLMMTSCTTALMQFMQMANQVGLNWSFDTIVNESLVQRARNGLCAKMMANKDATHFMFIDADISFSPDAILKLIVADKDIIAAAYPKKQLPINYNINLEKTTKVQGTLFTAYTAATGFLMFKREVYENLIKAHPEEKYVDDVGLGDQYNPYLYNIFGVYVDQDPNSISKGHLLSEDWAFCLRAKKIGYDIWIDSTIKLDHIGTYVFEGNTDLLKLKPQGQ